MDGLSLSESSKGLVRGGLIGGASAALGIFTIGFIFLQAIVLTIIVYIMLVRKYAAQRKMTPDAEVPTNGKAFMNAFFWGLGYFIIGIIINIITGGIFAMAGFGILIIAGIAYPILKNMGLSPKDVVNTEGVKVEASPFSTWTTAFIIAAVIGIIASISIAIVRYFIMQKVLKVAGPALAMAANVAAPGSGMVVSGLI